MNDFNHSYVGLLEGNLFLMYQSLSPIDFEMWYVFFSTRWVYCEQPCCLFEAQYCAENM